MIVKIRVLFLIFIGLCFGTIVFAQSNFEFFFGAKTGKYKDVVVKQVRSANTFVLEGGEKIQLIGLRAPQIPKVKQRLDRDEFGFVIKKETEPEWNPEEASFYFVRELLEGQHVRLEFDVEQKSEDHHTLAYAYLINGGTFVNVEILRQGFSYLQIRPPNMKYAKQLRDAYREARKEKRGVQGE